MFHLQLPHLTPRHPTLYDELASLFKKLKLDFHIDLSRKDVTEIYYDAIIINNHDWKLRTSYFFRHDPAQGMVFLGMEASYIKR